MKPKDFEHSLSLQKISLIMEIKHTNDKSIEDTLLFYIIM